MRLYRDTAGAWFGTQLEAGGRKGGWAQVDVPTDKDSLLAFLNAELPAQAAPLAIRELPPEVLASIAQAPPTKLNLEPLPITERQDATTNRLSRWAKAYERDPESMSAHSIMNELVWTLPLQDALAWAECAIARVRSLTAPAEPVDAESELA